MTGIVNRARRELRHYAGNVAYLFVCLGAVILFKDAVLRGHGLPPLPWGFALIKALILAKFMMVGEALHLGERAGERPLIWAILYRSVVFVLLLVVLTVVEHVVEGLLGGAGAVASVQRIGGGTVLEAAATILILLLVMIPYFAFVVLAEAMGSDRLTRLLFGNPAGPGR